MVFSSCPRYTVEWQFDHGRSYTEPVIFVAAWGPGELLVAVRYAFRVQGRDGQTWRKRDSRRNAAASRQSAGGAMRHCCVDVKGG